MAGSYGNGLVENYYINVINRIQQIALQVISAHMYQANCDLCMHMRNVNFVHQIPNARYTSILGRYRNRITKYIYTYM